MKKFWGSRVELFVGRVKARFHYSKRGLSRFIHTFVLTFCLLASFELAAFGQSATSGNVLNDGAQPILNISETQAFRLTTPPDTDSVSASQSLSGYEGLFFHMLSPDRALSKVQVSVDASTGNNDPSSKFILNTFRYRLAYDDPNAETAFVNCVVTSSSINTCPSDGGLLVPTSSIGTTVFLDPGFPLNTTSGFDSSRSIQPLDASGDATVTTTVALVDARYQGTGSNIRVETNNDNVDYNIKPIILENDVPLAPCPQGSLFASDQTTCYYDSSGVASYLYSLPNLQSSICNTLSMMVFHAKNTNPPTKYSFTFKENDKPESHCPTGMPGITVMGITPGQPPRSLIPCETGTNCLLPLTVPGLGIMTFLVGDNPGVSGGQFGDTNAVYSIDYPPSAAPAPPFGSLEAKTGQTVKDGPSQSAVVGIGDSLITTTGSGQGAWTLSQYGNLPVSSPPLRSADKYFDIEIAANSNLDEMKLKDCDLGGGNGLQWWDITSGGWVDVGPNQPAPVGSPPCIEFTLNNTTSPKVSQLTGTVFGVVKVTIATLTAKPKVALTSKFATVNSAVQVSLQISCSLAPCKGKVTLLKNQFVNGKRNGKLIKVKKLAILGQRSYSLAIGKLTKVLVPLNTAGRLAIGKVSIAHPSKIVVKINVENGQTQSISEKVI